MQETTNRPYSYLALGDSYTIGEKVNPGESFPFQTVAMLGEKGIHFHPPQIIATTGWSTDELAAAMEKATLRECYDFVTLLIGVNDQYRGRPASLYPAAFESLLERAIGLAGNDPSKVAVLSIPDWGITPFAEGRDRQQIALEIDEFNRINKQLAQKYRVAYIDVTPATRRAAKEADLLAEDGLHPSARAYTEWASWLASLIETRLETKG